MEITSCFIPTQLPPSTLALANGISPSAPDVFRCAQPRSPGRMWCQSYKIKHAVCREHGDDDNHGIYFGVILDSKCVVIVVLHTYSYETKYIKEGYYIHTKNEYQTL